jgi:Fe-S-cluster containining protein
MSRSRLERADHELLRVIDGGFRKVSAKAGPWLQCAPGCSDCCMGPFPITRLDQWRLTRGLSWLQSIDPQRAQEVRRRARSAAATVAGDYPGEAGTGRLDDDETRREAFFERFDGLACPVLDPATGRCDLYDWRPIPCRTYGPPLRQGQEQVPACRLCFVGASAETLEGCRLEFDPEGLEEAALEVMGADAGDWETIVAFALSLE